MSRRRWRPVTGQLTLALVCAAALGGCTGAHEPPAGTLSAPGTTSTTTPGSVPASSSPGATGATETSTSASVDPDAYQPATPTSPAKNVPVPVMPDAAKQKDLEGQKAFIQYWIDTYNYMRESGDSKPFLAACESSSKFCSGSVDILDDLETDSVWRVGGTVTAENIEAARTSDGEATAALRLTIVEQVSQYYSPSGRATAVPTYANAQQFDSVAKLKFTTDQWLLMEIGQQQ